MDRVVLDTNVVFEGVTQRDSAPGLLVESWLNGLFLGCVSNALAYEYLDVLSRKVNPKRWATVRHLLGAMLRQAEFIEIHFSWRPMSPDPSDDAVIDCGMNAAATVVTRNIRDFRVAHRELGLPVFSPESYLDNLVANLDKETP